MPAHPDCLTCTPCPRHRSRRASAGAAPVVLNLPGDSVDLIVRALQGHADGLAMRARSHPPEEATLMIGDSIRCSHLAGLIRRNVPTVNR